MSIFTPTFPWERVALLVVDMQNGFCHPECNLARNNDLSRISAIMPGLVELVRSCREAGLPIFWSQQEHFARDVTRTRRIIPSHLDRGLGQPCTRGTWEVDIVEPLASEVRPEDLVFKKRRASCFYGTNLECDLRMLGVTCLIVTGVTTNFCVDTTIREAYMRDLEVIVPSDACAAVAAADDLHQATLRNVSIYFGHVTTVKEIQEGLRLAGRVAARA